VQRGAVATDDVAARPDGADRDRSARRRGGHRAEAALLALLIAALPMLLDSATASARLAELRRDFVARPKAQSMAALAALADEAPDTPAAARALDWLGDLKRGDGDRAGAEAAYARAYRSHDDEGHRLAARGLADLALDSGHFVRAEALYRDARAGATGVLAIELDQKIAFSRKSHRRALAEWACWAFVAFALAFFIVRSRVWQPPRLGVPIESVYAAPLYALLILGCVGRDPLVLHALWLCAAWSLALLTTAGLAWRRQSPVGNARLAHAALLTLANVALFYAVLNHAAILDSLFFTVAP
jgi:hypothetical protein